jgi:beta-galactosidase beta subunit
MGGQQIVNMHIRVCGLECHKVYLDVHKLINSRKSHEYVRATFMFVNLAVSMSSH